MATHTKKRPFVCEICNSAFTQSYSLVKHNRIHTGERPFSCEYCNMRFYSSDHVKRHVRTHTGKLLSCLAFPRLITISSVLGEKPYICEFCPKAFAQNGDLNKHKRLHLGENTYKCTEDGCSASYRLQSDLRNHLKVHYCKDEDIIEEEETVENT